MPNKLVWAPLYLFGNQLFCARLCESDEINRDLHINTPVLEGDCVVEMICAPKTKAGDTKLLTVHKDKVIPYYGKRSNVDEIDKTKWSEHHTNKLKAVSIAICVALTVALLIVHLPHTVSTGPFQKVEESRRRVCVQRDSQRFE